MNELKTFEDVQNLIDEWVFTKEMLFDELVAYLWTFELDKRVEEDTAFFND